MSGILKRFRVPLIVAGILCLLLTAVLIAHRVQASKTAGSEAQPAQTAEETQDQQTEYSMMTEVDEADAVSIVFSDNGVRTRANDDAVKIDGTDVTIRAPGTYTLSGSCANGSVTVKKGTQGVVLILDGLELTADGTAAISCNKGTEVTIMAAEGSDNTLADTEDNNDETNPSNSNAENAVLKCKDGARVLLCGTGTLNIAASGKNGIKAGASDAELGEASLTITELALNVTAPNDGVKADSILTITSGRITVNAGDDAIRSDTAVTIGAEETDGPTLEISGCTEGIEAPQVQLLSGDVSIQASDDGINAPKGDGTTDITIAGGTLFVDAAQGDGLDSNGTLNITGGDVRIFSSSRSDNSPIDSGSDLSITGGTVLAVGSSGMAQEPNAAAQTYLVFSAGNSIGGPQGGFGGAPNSIEFSLTAGDIVQITDEKGAVLAEAEAKRGADYVFYSNASLADGGTYSLNVNGTAVGTAEATDELSAFGGLPDMGDPGGGSRPEMPDNGNFDPNNMPQRPDGDFDPNNMPQRPDEDFDPNNMPQRPDGDFDPNNMPQLPDGDFDLNNLPQAPDGNFEPGSRPQPPGQNVGTDAQSGATAESGEGKDA